MVAADELLTVDVCGKRISEYLVEALSLYNRGNDRILIRGIGSEAAKAVQLAYILKRNFNAEIDYSDIGTFTVDGMERDAGTTYITIEVKWDSKLERKEVDKKHWKKKKDGFIEYGLYAPLFDNLIYGGEAEIYHYENGKRVHILTLKDNGDGDLIYIVPDDLEEETRKTLLDSLYRAGAFMPHNWREIAIQLSKYDDIILGIDTNILLDVNISEHILPSLIAYNPIKYAHTPNWILFVIPSTAMHEIEEWANNRNKDGLLKWRGRRGFRALQEIIMLTNSADISGISIVISGETDPVVDTKVEIEGLRQDIQEAIR